VNVEQWAKHLRARVERERVDFLVEWARKNGVERENPTHIRKSSSRVSHGWKAKGPQLRGSLPKESRKTKKVRMKKETEKILTGKVGNK
jgi:hypothetical protein